MNTQLTENETTIAKLFLALGLLFIIAKGLYEYFFEERFNFYHLFHPVRSITVKERHFINQFIEPYQSFDNDKRRRFLKRFAWFKSKKNFVFYGTIENREEIKAYVASSAILVTMRLNDFRFQKAINRIVVYPSTYYSRIAKRHHIGEYNPSLKTLVFSAEDLKEGFRIPNDAINLGIHEIAHALMVEMHKKATWEARRFNLGLKQIRLRFNSPVFQEELSKSTLFRAYAQTNFIEFFAVLTEVFYEKNSNLKVSHPVLHDSLSSMLNVQEE